MHLPLCSRCMVRVQAGELGCDFCKWRNKKRSAQLAAEGDSISPAAEMEGKWGPNECCCCTCCAVKSGLL